MNNGIIIKCHDSRPVVWLQIKIQPERSPVWVPRLVTPDEEVIVRGLGLRVGHIGETAVADMGRNMEFFHSPKFWTIPTKHTYFTDSHQAQEKRSMANFFFADHMMQVKPASVLDEASNDLLMCQVKLTVQESYAKVKREAVMVCYGRLPEIPVVWKDNPEYIKTMADMERRHDLMTLQTFLDHPTHKTKCVPIQLKLLEKFEQLRGETK